MSVSKESWFLRADDAQLERLKRDEDPRPYLVALSRAGRLNELGPDQFVSYLREGFFEGLPLESYDVKALDGENLVALLKDGYFNPGRTLHGVNLQGADLLRADLREVDLQGANFYRADLYGANLFQANLLNSNLKRADLRGADLRGASLGGALIESANLHGANLEGASLRGASYFFAQLEGTRGTPIT